MTGYRWFAIALVVIAMSAVPFSQRANAQTIVGSVDDLTELCRSPSGTMALTECRMFMLGALQTYDFMIETGRARRVYCPSKNVTARQARKVFVKWGGDHPEYLHEDAAPALIKALKEAFPCLPEVEIIGPAK